ncbi:MAG TPA: glycosyl transferase family 1 [Lentisphaeria bacterium]|nr:MAG: glycosyl transferase family 1 [Lentisphaerae bacterium GWF2_38_69]HBM14887.1 glycosyl transferase family 1 [Lentisphaeria bacterium]
MARFWQRLKELTQPDTPSTNVGFVSTRFAGTDGVSLETLKWAKVLEEANHKCFWYAGKLDHSEDVSMCVHEAFFNHPENIWISEQIWGKTARTAYATERIRIMAQYLKETLYAFVKKFNIHILVFENVLSIPMHVPLGIAISELIAETHIPAIAHHHDFYWERIRFSVSAVDDMLDTAFPSRDSDLQHVVINQAAQEDLARRKGVPSIIIPNVIDFENPPPPPDDYTKDLRQEMGLEPDDIVILQPTRVVPRKGIEHSIELVRALGDKKYKLVISHDAGDEGFEYRNMLAEMAKQSGVDLRFFATRVGDIRRINEEGKKVYTLWDIYPIASLVTYPSLYEGFGNAFLEAVYFKKPVLINRYAIFHRDIEPKGFEVTVMDGYLTKSEVSEVRVILEDEKLRNEIVEHNYKIAAHHYSYAELRRHLETLILNITKGYYHDIR